MHGHQQRGPRNSLCRFLRGLTHAKLSLCWKTGVVSRRPLGQCSDPWENFGPTKPTRIGRGGTTHGSAARSRMAADRPSITGQREVRQDRLRHPGRTTGIRGRWPSRARCSLRLARYPRAMGAQRAGPNSREAAAPCYGAIMDNAEPPLPSRRPWDRHPALTRLRRQSRLP